MGQFGRASILAVDICKRDALSPAVAWRIACSEKISSVNSRKKGCPRATFLGMVRAGLINGIAAGVDACCQSSKNGQYAAVAVGVLRESPMLAKNENVLWKTVMGKLGQASNKAPNNQMDIVISLWNQGLVNT